MMTFLLLFLQANGAGPDVQPRPHPHQATEQAHTIGHDQPAIAPQKTPPVATRRSPSPITNQHTAETTMGATPVGMWPTIAWRGWRAALLLAIAAALAGTLGAMTGALKESPNLMSRGVVPTGLRLLETSFKLLAIFFLLGAFGALVPESLVPVLPWILVAVAIAIGWSARDFLPDVFAWAAVTAEGRPTPGQWVSINGETGRVQEVGLRSSVITLADKSELRIPNRLWTQEAWTLKEQGPGCQLRVELALPNAKARRVLEQAAALSPWTRGRAVVRPEGPNTWLVDVSLLSPEFEDRFRAAYPAIIETMTDPGQGRPSPLAV